MSAVLLITDEVDFIEKVTAGATSKSISVVNAQSGKDAYIKADAHDRKRSRIR
jgi:hypothetical protein